MRILSIFALVLSLTATASAQLFDPLKIVKWSAEAKPAGKGEFDITFTATVEKGWNIYAQDVPKGGPIPTTITFDKKGGVVKSGAAKEVCEHKKVAKDENFEMVLTKYYDKVSFTQRVKTTATSAKGVIEFMTCNHERCLPPSEYEFNVVLNGKATASTALAKKK